MIEVDNLTVPQGTMYNRDMSEKRLAFKQWYALRFAVLRRDNFQCQYCGQHAPNVKLEVDHIVPIAEGGTNAMENLKTSCYACNRGKSGLWIIESNGASPQHHITRPPPSETTCVLILKELGVRPHQSASELITALHRTGEAVKKALQRLKSRGALCSTPTDQGKKWSLIDTKN